MKHNLKSPCTECPFRRVAPAGWLGPWTPKQLVELYVFTDGAFACHQTIKADDADGDQAEQCAGMSALMCNAGKLPRDGERADHIRVVGKREDVFDNVQQFSDHHERD